MFWIIKFLLDYRYKLFDLILSVIGYHWDPIIILITWTSCFLQVLFFFFLDIIIWMIQTSKPNNFFQNWVNILFFVFLLNLISLSHTNLLFHKL